MSTEMSPEERLLKHIRQKKDAASPVSGSVRKSAQKSSSRAPADFAAFFGNLLVALSLVLAGYIAYEVFVAPKDTLDVLAALSTQGNKEVVLPTATSQKEQFDYYEQRMQRRDIFDSPLRRDKKEVTEESYSSAPELTKNLKLVGIVMLRDRPEAVIEDVNVKETFFVYVGDRISNAVVENILEDKVILNFNDQKVELMQ